ncbi:MAG TPA: hypothetical protein VMR21_17580 [Vicinamibacteria bacterium]|nr:hypothetical protein [Vicinamibacteria bacterium]
MSRMIGLSTVWVAMSLLAACGGSGGTTAPSTPVAAPPPPAPVRTIVSQGSGSVEAHVLGSIPFTTTSSGTLDFTVDWTSPQSLIAVYVARGACEFDQFLAGACDLLLRSETMVPKPKVLQIPSAAAGSYVLLIGNPGDEDESVSFQIGLTSTPGAAATSGEDAPARGSRPIGAYTGPVDW